MFCSEDDIFGPCATKYLRPGIGIPFLSFAIENRSEIVVIVIGAVVFTMVSLGRRAIQPHAVEVPLCVRIVSNVVLRVKIMLRMNEGSPTRDGVETPVYKYP